MALSPRLELRQSQTLVMTPQLQQAIKLLQLNNMELTAFVEQELERNPLLERSSTEEGAGDDLDRHVNGAEPEDPTLARDSRLESLRLDDDKPPTQAAQSSMDTDYDNTFTNDSAGDSPEAQAGGEGDPVGYSASTVYGTGGSTRFEDSDQRLENALGDHVSLTEHVLRQLHLLPLGGVEQAIALQLVGALDEAGYVGEPLAEVAERLNCPLDRVEAVLLVLQGVDPAGLFARSLKECLALQLKELDRLDPAMACLLDNLELLARHELPQLMRLCGVDGEDMADMIQELRRLNPKPGLAFLSETVQTVVPDIFVRRGRDGAWVVELNSDTLPRVLVNMRYFRRVSHGTADREQKAWISDQLNSANWLVKSLDQRANTILKVASEIVRQQDAFLAHGVQHLRPLNLKAVAEAIGMHESTVSRVTANKYLASPRGIYELKYFFTAAIQAVDGGAALSAEAVRHRIRTLIDAEPPTEILSDDRIVELLHAAGVDIARRTVAKYREAMGIASSVQRRRQKRMRA
ncbi:MAG: RNA polymerase factor sigma-54 [Sneathiellaceae bacterium]